MFYGKSPAAQLPYEPVYEKRCRISCEKDRRGHQDPDGQIEAHRVFFVKKRIDIGVCDIGEQIDLQDHTGYMPREAAEPAAFSPAPV